MSMACTDPALDNSPRTLSFRVAILSVRDGVRSPLNQLSGNSAYAINCIPTKLPSVVSVSGPNSSSSESLLILPVIFCQSGGDLFGVVRSYQEEEVSFTRKFVAEI